MSFDPPRGVPPTIEQRAIGELMVDHSYQRAADQRAIDAIAKSWDWRLCAPLTVSRRGAPPAFYVIDGQHRLEAARMRGDIQYLPCIISSFETIEEEAGLFVKVNRKRRPPNALETFKAEVAAGDEKALQIIRVITEAGLAVAAHTNPTSWKPRQISAIQGVRGAIFRYGEQVAAAALADLVACWPDEVLQHGGRMLLGLYKIHAAPPADFDRDRFRAMLRERSHMAWHTDMVRRIAKFGEIAESASHYTFADAWDAYSKRSVAA